MPLLAIEAKIIINFEMAYNDSSNNVKFKSEQTASF